MTRNKLVNQARILAPLVVIFVGSRPAEVHVTAIVVRPETLWKVWPGLALRPAAWSPLRTPGASPPAILARGVALLERRQQATVGPRLPAEQGTSPEAARKPLSAPSTELLRNWNWTSLPHEHRPSSTTSCASRSSSHCQEESGLAVSLGPSLLKEPSRTMAGWVPVADSTIRSPAQAEIVTCRSIRPTHADERAEVVALDRDRQAPASSSHRTGAPSRPRPP